MAYAYDTGNIGGANGGAEVMFDLKQLLVAQGWDVPRSGEGVGGAVANSDLITTVAKMNVSRAWFRLRAPAGMSPRREFCIQRGSSGEAYWWIKVSAEDTFTATAGDEDDMATATDGQNLHGTTTAGDVLFNAASSYKYHMAADSAAPYTWYAMALTNATGATAGVIAFEALAAGSFPTADQDPALYHAYSGASGFSVGTLGSSSYAPIGWWKKDLAGEAWIRHVAHYYYSGSFGYMLPSSIGTNPYDGDDNIFPIPFGRGASGGAQIGWKGFGHMMRWVGKDRANGDTLSVSGARDKIIVDDVALPWDGSVPAL